MPSDWHTEAGAMYLIANSLFGKGVYAKPVAEAGVNQHGAGIHTAAS